MSDSRIRQTCQIMIDYILNLIFRPITLADYNQREQEDFYFWIHEIETGRRVI